MFIHDVQLRVRYAETDQMGYVYYANYAIYYEVARVETLRALGYDYHRLEAEDGIMMPVLETYIRYHKPAFYDQLLTLRTIIRDIPNSRFRFDYEVYNPEQKLINQGYTTLIFVNRQSGKPIRCPEVLIRLLKPYFQQKHIEQKRSEATQ